MSVIRAGATDVRDISSALSQYPAALFFVVVGAPIGVGIGYFIGERGYDNVVASGLTGGGIAAVAAMGVLGYMSMR
jgi:hypothetical protein